jgi:hypothetical protein
MRLALLGSDDSVQALLRDLPAEHTIVAAYEAREDQLPLAALLPGVERRDQWESLLVRDDVDLIIVASPRNLPPTADGLDPQVRRVNQLKKLAQAGKSLLVSHPACDVLDAYEIEMLRRDGGGVILPWFRAAYHPVWRDLPIDPDSGSDEPILWERTLTQRSRDEVLDLLSRDLYLIEAGLGKLKRVTALGGPASGVASSTGAWQSLTVQIETAGGHVVRWSGIASPSDLACRVSNRSQERTWELRAPQNATEPVTLDNSSGHALGAWDEWNEAAETLERFETLLVRSTEVSGEDWLAACRSLEAIAAVERSLQRGRAIELSQAEQTEEHAFKGVMASSGCLILLLLLFAMFIVALVEGLQLPLRKLPLWRAWPIALIVPLAIFLALQFLQTIIEKPRSEGPS